MLLSKTENRMRLLMLIGTLLCPSVVHETHEDFFSQFQHCQFHKQLGFKKFSFEEHFFV